MVVTFVTVSRNFLTTNDSWNNIKDLKKKLWFRDISFVGKIKNCRSKFCTRFSAVATSATTIFVAFDNDTDERTVLGIVVK